MHDMKAKHVRIASEMDVAYRRIEADTEVSKTTLQNRGVILISLLLFVMILDSLSSLSMGSDQ